ncbi:hypothetical protein D6774_02805 [Candidatus Woesearchaeota archaeon]|nr:MAG: hypothetical protein D6774_02805 [Candidatus Woesearchaeota archaeon]
MFIYDVALYVPEQGKHHIEFRHSTDTYLYCTFSQQDPSFFCLLDPRLRVDDLPPLLRSMEEGTFFRGENLVRFLLQQNPLEERWKTNIEEGLRIGHDVQAYFEVWQEEQKECLEQHGYVQTRENDLRIFDIISKTLQRRRF